MISIDTKKKELIGPFKNKGRRWRTDPVEVPTNIERDVFTETRTTAYRLKNAWFVLAGSRALATR